MVSLKKKKDSPEDLLSMSTEKSKAQSLAQMDIGEIFAKLLPSLSKKKNQDESGTVLKEVKAKLPRVNILPPALVMEIRRRKLRRGLGLVIGGVIAAIIGVYLFQGTLIASATEKLESTNTSVQGTMVEAGRLAPIGDYYNSLQSSITAGTDEYRKQVNYPEIMNGIYQSAPYGLTVAQITIEYYPEDNVEPPPCGTETQPFADASIRPLGCIVITGTSSSHQAIEEFTTKLEGVTSIMAPFIAPGQVDQTGQITFTGSAAISPVANMNNAAATLIDTQNLPGLSIVVPGSTVEETSTSTSTPSQNPAAPSAVPTATPTEGTPNNG